MCVFNINTTFIRRINGIEQITTREYNCLFLIGNQNYNVNLLFVALSLRIILFFNFYNNQQMFYLSAKVHSIIVYNHLQNCLYL